MYVVLVIAGWIVIAPVLIAQFGEADAGAAGIIKLGVLLAVGLPMAFLAAKIAGRRPGTLSSIAGRLRMRWLGTCVLVSLLTVVLSIGAYMLARALGIDVGPDHKGAWIGWSEFLPLAAVVVLVIPLQASAEEYAFRGILMQVLGAWIPPAWIVVAITSIAFGLAHGLGVEGFVAITWFGAVMGWLTVRTGGLEAAVALHSLNNVSAFVLQAALGRSDVWVTELNAHITWAATAIDVAINTLFGVLIAKLYDRFARSSRS